MGVFSSQLRAWRTGKGWSQIELSKNLHCSNTLISQVENQEKSPSVEFAERCDEVFGTPGTFVAMQELVAREAWPSYFAPVIDAETRATQVHVWDQRGVPGLLQTEDYARSVIRAGQPRMSADEIERKVASRLERQAILQRPSGRPLYWAVLHEGALRHVVGSPEVMRAQLDKIIEAADAPDIVIQVLPYTARSHPGTDGPILIFDYPDAPSSGYTECNGGGMIVEQPEQVVNLITSMNLIRAAAMSPDDSRGHLVKIRNEIA